MELVHCRLAERSPTNEANQGATTESDLPQSPAEPSAAADIGDLDYPSVSPSGHVGKCPFHFGPGEYQFLPDHANGDGTLVPEADSNPHARSGGGF